MDERDATRRARHCDTHAGAPSVGVCGVCGRTLCLACAVPVRGRLIGVECLGTVLEDPPPPPAESPPARRAALWIAAGGFILVLLLTLLPWSRFGEWSGVLGAWGPHWSLLAVLAAGAGLAVAVVALRRGLSARIEVPALVAAGTCAAAAAMLHYRYPPPLARPSPVALAAALAGLLALAAGMMRARRRPRTTEDLKRREGAHVSAARLDGDAVVAARDDRRTERRPDGQVEDDQGPAEVSAQGT